MSTQSNVNKNINTLKGSMCRTYKVVEMSLEVNWWREFQFQTAGLHLEWLYDRCQGKIQNNQPTTNKSHSRPPTHLV